MLAELKAQLGNFTANIAAGPGDTLAGLHGYLIGQFGAMATWSIYLAAAAIAVLVIWRLVKLSFDILRCVAIPSVAVALVGAWLSPLAFMHILPVAAALFAGLMLFRG